MGSGRVSRCAGPRSLLAIACSVAFLWSVPAALAAQEAFPFHLYLPRTLSEINAKTALDIADLPASISGQAKLNPIFMIDSRMQRARVLVRFTGEKRPISPDKKTYIDRYFRSMSGVRQLQDTFENEYRFDEAGTRYWLPIANNLEPYMAEELEPGSPVDLYMVIAGSLSTGGKSELLALVFEFQDRGS